jgi:glycosyltransferase involved in cell wall biosynthesis
MNSTDLGVRQTNPGSTGIVSIVMIFLNAEAFIREAIESVLKQTYTNWELLLVDDGSTDASTQIAKSYVAKYPSRVRYLEHPGHVNRGMSPTRNVGVRASRGEFVAFLDADDVWEPDKLTEQVAIMRNYDDLGMVCGTVLYWRSWASGDDELIATGHVLDIPVAPPDALLALYPLGRADAPCPSDVLIRKAILERVGGFEEHFTSEKQLYEDQAFFCKLYVVAPVYFSSAVWLKYRQHPDSCVSVVHRAGQYSGVRQFFLLWLKDELAKRSQLSPPIASAIQRSLWPYHHPVFYYCFHVLPTRVLNKMLRMILAPARLGRRRSEP